MNDIILLSLVLLKISNLMFLEICVRKFEFVTNRSFLFLSWHTCFIKEWNKVIHCFENSAILKKDSKIAEYDLSDCSKCEKGYV